MPLLSFTPPASLDLALSVAGVLLYVALAYGIGFVFLLKQLRFSLLDLLLLMIAVGCTFPWFVSTDENGFRPFGLAVGLTLIFFAWALGVKNCEWQRATDGWVRASVIFSTALQLLLPLIALPSYYLLVAFAHFVLHEEHGMMALWGTLLALMTLAMLITFGLSLLLSIGTLYEVLMGVNVERKPAASITPAGND